MKQQQRGSSSGKTQQRIAPALFFSWQAPSPLAPLLAEAVTGGVSNAVEAWRRQHEARVGAVDAIGAAIRLHTGAVAAVAEAIACAAQDVYCGPLAGPAPTEPRQQRKVERAATAREHVTTLALRMRGDSVYKPDR